MGVRFPSVSITATGVVLPANANETVLAVTPPLNISLDFAQIFLTWFANMLAGTGTTALVFRLRRGTTVLGATIGNTSWPFTTVAGNNVVVGGGYPDTPGAVAGQQYALTVSQTGATAAGTLNDCAVLAFAL